MSLDHESAGVSIVFFDWFGRNWTPKLREPKPLWTCGPEMATEKEESRKLSPDDDLMTRAENMVWALGFKGNVAKFEKKAYEVLKAYKKLDENDKGKV